MKHTSTKEIANWKLKSLRYLLDEAYQQMQQGQFRYAASDAACVMREAVSMLLRHKKGCVSDDLLTNLRACERRRLLGADKKFVRRLYEAYRICSNGHGSLEKEKNLNYRKVRFAIMQLKDLLNFTQHILSG